VNGVVAVCLCILMGLLVGACLSGAVSCFRWAQRNRRMGDPALADYAWSLALVTMAVLIAAVAFVIGTRALS
jgi:hypothetical protein